MWLCSFLIAESVRIKIVDAPLMLTLKTYTQLLYTQQLYAKKHVIIIDNQYIVSM